MKVIVPVIALREIDALGEELSDKIFALLRDIRMVGILKIPPTRKKKLRGEIWEFRITGKDGIARTLYASVEKDTLCVLLSFIKKTQETPARYLQLAEERLLRFRKEFKK